MTGPAMDDARLDALLRGLRDDLDADIAGSGAPARVRAAALAGIAPATVLPWRRIAAATLVAALFGGAVDYAMPRAGDPVEIAMSDPLFAADLAFDRPAAP